MERPFRRALILVALGSFLLSWPYVLYEPAMPTERVHAEPVDSVRDSEPVADLSDVQEAKRPDIREAIETGNPVEFQFRTPPDVGYVAYEGDVYSVTTLVSGPEGLGHGFYWVSMPIGVIASFGAAHAVGVGLRRRYAR